MATQKDPNEVVHFRSVRVRRSSTRGSATARRATLHVRRGDLDRVDGKYAEVHPHDVPDVAGRK